MSSATTSFQHGTIILGAGIAGLSAAYHLQALNPQESIEVFERSDVIGGAASSFTIQDYTFDLAIHILYSKDVYAARLIKNLLCNNYRSLQRKSFIFSSGVLTKYPYQANLFGLPERVIKENIEGLTEIRGRIPSTKNFHEWIMSTFGRGIAKHFMIPFNEKVWATDLRTMAASWIADRVPIPSLEAVIAGSTAEGSQIYGDNESFWYPKNGGIAALAHALADALQTTPSLNSEAKSISPRNKSITFADGSVRSFAALIPTLPLPTLVGLIHEAPARVREAAARLRANKVHTFAIGIRREAKTPAHWIYFPEPEFVFQRVSFPSNLSNGLAPRGCSSLLIEISEPINSFTSIEEYRSRTLRGLLRCGLITPEDELEVFEHRLIEPAYVIYDQNHRAAVDEIHAYLRAHDIYSCGRFGEWEYLNMDHSLLSGKRAAAEVASKLSPKFYEQT